MINYELFIPRQYRQKALFPEMFIAMPRYKTQLLLFTADIDVETTESDESALQDRLGAHLENAAHKKWPFKRCKSLQWI